MTARLLPLGLVMPLTVLVSNGLFTAQLLAAEDKPAGRPIEIPETATSQVTSNSHQLVGKSKNLKNLEDDPFKVKKSPFSPESSLEAVLVPPSKRPQSGAPALSKKAKEQMERQKNWAFMSPDELASGPTMEEIFNIHNYDSNGQEKKKRSAVERFYERLDREANSDTNNIKGLKAEQYDSTQRDSRDDDQLRQQANTAKDPREAERESKRVFNQDSDKTAIGAGPTRGTAADIFGLGDSKVSPEFTKVQKARLEEFKQLLALPGPGGDSPPLKSLTTPGPIFKPLNSADGPGVPLVPAPKPVFDLPSPGATSFRSPAALPDFSSGFGQPAFTPVLPRYEAPVITPVLPNFNPPKRPF